LDKSTLPFSYTDSQYTSGSYPSVNSSSGLDVIFSKTNENDNHPVVFVGLFDNHSNFLPWRESGYEVVNVPERPKTYQVNVDELGRVL
jgi:hypothetical protein